MNQDSAFDDASIPVLTEVVQEAAQEAPTAPAAPPAPAAAALPDWDALEQRLCERILQQLQGQVDIVVEKRLREGMADVMQHLLAGLTDELHAGLRHAVEQVVAREVAHIRANDA